MTCEFDPLPKVAVQPHPCTPAATDRNWDKVIDALKRVGDRIDGLNECFNNAIADTALVRFRLTEALSLSGEADAVILNRVFDDPDWVWEVGDAIVVVDTSTTPGFNSGAVGYEGWAIPGPDDEGTYLIVWMEHKAKIIDYRLTSNFSGTSATATVLDYHDGHDPGSTVTVYDPQARGGGWHRYDCKGKAHWSPENGQYEVYDCELVCKKFKGVLVYDICDDEPLETPTASVVEWIKDGQHNIPWYEYIDISEDPENPVFSWEEVEEFAIENYCSHRGQAGRPVKVEARYHISTGGEDVSEFRWDIYDMGLLDKGLVTSLTWDDETCTLSANTESVTVEGCGSATGPIDVGIPFSAVTLPETFSPQFEEVMIEGVPTWVCRINATTGDYCAIRVDDGAPIEVAEFERREYVTDWFLQNDAADPEVDPAEWNIYVDTEYAWVPCWQAKDPTLKYALDGQEFVYDFDPTDPADVVPPADPECKVEGLRKKIWGFELVAADPVDAVVFQEREAVIDVAVNVDELEQTTEMLWVMCYDTGATTTILDFDDCAEA